MVYRVTVPKSCPACYAYDAWEMEAVVRTNPEVERGDPGWQVVEYTCGVCHVKIVVPGREVPA